MVVGYADEREKSNASAIITVAAENWMSGLHGDKLNWGDKPAKDNQGVIQLNAGDTLKAWYDPKAKGRIVAIQVGNANPVVGKNAHRSCRLRRTSAS